MTAPLPPLPDPEMIYDKEADVLVDFAESGAIDMDDGRVCPTCVRLYTQKQVKLAVREALERVDALCNEVFRPTPKDVSDKIRAMLKEYE